MPRILISAGEASSDLYAASLVDALRRRMPEARFFGCAGTRMQAAGVEPVVDAASLSVVGLVEVLVHIPRIYGEFRKLVRAAEAERPDVAILTDSPDFHLRLAPKLRRLGVPIVYFVAPQVWAWRKGRLPLMRRVIDRLLCIFPFEEAFFQRHGIAASYIGHPLTRLVQPTLNRTEFRLRHRLPQDRPVVVLLPGSRVGEVGRHLPALAEAARQLSPEAACILALPAGFTARAGEAFFRERIGSSPIQVVEGQTWDCIAQAEVALAASGTVTVETALLGTPMVTFYRVTALSWWLGRFLVSIPFYSMVNLVAGRRIVPEVMQDEMTGERLAAEVRHLLQDAEARERMRRDLAEVQKLLASDGDPMERAADTVQQVLCGRQAWAERR